MNIITHEEMTTLKLAVVKEVNTFLEAVGEDKDATSMTIIITDNESVVDFKELDADNLPSLEPVTKLTINISKQMGEQKQTVFVNEFVLVEDMVTNLKKVTQLLPDVDIVKQQIAAEKTSSEMEEVGMKVSPDVETTENSNTENSPDTDNCSVQ